jgi:hypothetical protein
LGTDGIIFRPETTERSNGGNGRMNKPTITLINLEYLKSISPNGLLCYCFIIDWDIIEKMATVYGETGEDQFDDYVQLAQIDNGWQPKNLPLLELLFSNSYVFSPSDLYNKEELEKVKSFYEKEKQKLSPEGKRKTRRAIACRVTNMAPVRQAVFQRDNYMCRYCGSKDNLTVDHIIPVSKDGKDEFDNFQTLCKKCNSSKLDKVVA